MSVERERHWMRAPTRRIADSGRVVCRAVHDADVAELGRLIYQSHHGTIDDEGETPPQSVREAFATLSGRYGPFLHDASFVHQGADGRILSASLVTFWKKAPLLAFSMTLPEAQGRGLARATLERSLDALARLGHPHCFLAVTEGNARAQRLYDHLGFEKVPERARGVVTIEPMEKPEFDRILESLPEYWGERAKDLRAVHHPIYIHEFGETAFTLWDGERLAGYLCGFVVPSKKLGYIHLVGVKEKFRKLGYARKLYEHFFEAARQDGCTRVKAMTQAVNTGSIAFHRAMGFELLGLDDGGGVPVYPDYRGRGEDRVVFVKSLQ